MSDLFSWDDDGPPAISGRGRPASRQWEDVLATLRGNPGQWAHLDGYYNGGITGQLRKAAGVDADFFEIKTRTVKDIDPPRNREVWIRYNDELPEDEAE